MIELVGSNAGVRRPTDAVPETASQDGTDDEGATPTPGAPTEDVDIDPYRTPVALTPANRRNKATIMAEPGDTSSDIELVTFKDLKKQRALTTGSAADKVCTSLMINLTSF